MTVIEATPVQATPVPVSGRRSTMQVRKRNGDAEDVDVNKIVRAVERWTRDLNDVDPLRVATKTISGLYDGATTAELDRLSIRTAAEMIRRNRPTHGWPPGCLPATSTRRSAARGSRRSASRSHWGTPRV